MDITDIEQLDLLNLEWDNSIDDVSLSQIGMHMEREAEMYDEMENFTLSQAVEMYDVADDIFSTDFNLTAEPITTESVIEQFDNICNNSSREMLVKSESSGGNILSSNQTEEPITTESVIEQLDNLCYNTSPETVVKNESSGGNSRFGPIVEDSDVTNLIKSNESRNTRKNTNWSLSTFNEWKQMRATAGYDIPNLLEMDINGLNNWLSKFIIEARRKDGAPYPPRLLYMLCTGLLRYMRENGKHENFLDEKDSRFYEFRKALSARMAELTCEGIGTSTKQAEPISEETENKLWETGFLGNDSAQSLLNIVFYYNCKLFGLRGVDEHRNLDINQFQLGNDQVGLFIMFTGRASKTYKGGLNQRHVMAKNIKHHFQNEKLFQLYKQYLESVSDGKCTAFYRRPSDNMDDGQFRYSSQVLGVNKLLTIMKTMCSDAKIHGYFTNHSGKRTCVTSLYQAGIPEQEIMARTGHRSVESVRKYKRPSSDMLRDISNILEPPCSENKKVKSEHCVSETKSENRERNSENRDGNGIQFSNCVFNFKA